MFNVVSVDGFFAGVDGNIDWHVVDDEFNNYAVEFLDTIDTIMFGRITYKMFEDFWPTAIDDPKTGPADRIIAKAIDAAKKVVFSKSLTSVDWNNSELQNEIDVAEIKKLKYQTSSKDIVIYGSGTIVKQLASLGLIDEYRLMVNPVILGEGRSLFEGVPKMRLELIETQKFSSNNALLAYRPL